MLELSQHKQRETLEILIYNIENFEERYTKVIEGFKGRFFLEKYNYKINKICEKIKFNEDNGKIEVLDLETHDSLTPSKKNI